MVLPPEFSRIARHFRPIAGPGSLDLTDDAAVFAPPPGRELVVTADAMVEGVHFLPATAPGLIARKLLRVNLSDLAAMGATPLGYLITISVPRSLGDDWFTGFAAGLKQDQETFAISLLGGDTTETPGPLTLSLTAIGHVAPGGAILRSGAQPGDDVWVTGTIGDGVLGLHAARGELADPDGYLKGRYDCPTPRLGLPLVGWAHAAMDVSDGLFQDLGHICRASGLAATVEASQIPLSPQAIAAGVAWREKAWIGGDDYELLLAAPPGVRPPGIRATRIGRFQPGEGVIVLGEQGQTLDIATRGWSHFA
ncbi:thiamine-phosphate kinase [Acidisphaera sp. L21]|uniref:thiamine-phosphate kinase n=1 Tax=Acidisphaera sp. L21 TaxID=1641851 RepID=UPI00131DB560|nr:thiamine-phosphate kinase [Acidisphaera sp. L21]